MTLAELCVKRPVFAVMLITFLVVLGVFSFRSFAQDAATATLEDWTSQKCAPGDLRVDEFLEKFEFARVTDEMTQVFAAME